MNMSDPFTGTWLFTPELSTLSTPAPQSWLQEINVIDNELFVRERTLRTDGTETSQTVRAKFDGTPYPVVGSPIMDFIAYTRTDRNTIAGIGSKQGTVLLTGTVSVANDRTSLTLNYKIHIAERIVAHGIAVFIPE